MEMENPKPKVGTGVMVFKDNKVLMGLRKHTSHGSGEYCFPGGKMEYWESFEDCIRRETKEETGLEIKNIRFVSLTNNKFYPPFHFVTAGFAADWVGGEVRVMEEDKFEKWEWFELENLPKNIFRPSKMIIDAYLEKRIFQDS